MESCLRSYQRLLPSTYHRFQLPSSATLTLRLRRYESPSRLTIRSRYSNDSSSPQQASPPPSRPELQLYGQIERLLTDAARQSQNAWGTSEDWDEIEGAWVVKPKSGKPNAVVHFVGGVFVGAAPQLTYRLFLEKLAEKGILVIATPFGSGFDHLLITDEVQFKFERCLRAVAPDNVLPVFGIGHSLGCVIHLLIGSRYAVQKSGNALISFNNKDASSAVPLFSPVVVPMAQRLGPILNQIASSPTMRFGAEMTLKQLETLSPPLVKQLRPLFDQLPALYMDLVNGREDFSPHPRDTRRMVKAYYGISRNLLVKFKDDSIDETTTLAEILSSRAAVSATLDMSVRTLPGDHVLPLQQSFSNAPGGMADAVSRGSELLESLTAGTPWEAVARDVGTSFGYDARPSTTTQDLDLLLDVLVSWIASNSPPKLLQP